MDKSIKKPLLVALAGERPKRIPVWFMRQAGRCLPEYRAIKARLPTYQMFQTPDVAAEVTLQPLRRFDLDAAIVYADILHIPDALGLGLAFVQGDGPVFSKPIREVADIEALPNPADSDRRNEVLSKLAFITDTIKLVKPALSSNQTLIGFAGAPWTVVSYMVEGGGSKTFFKTKRLMMEQPAAFLELMKTVANWTILYLQSQIDAGVEVIQLFESWAGMALSPWQYSKFAKPFTDWVLSGISGVPRIHYVNHSAGILDQALGVNCEGFGVDWGQDLSGVVDHPSTGERTLMGNLDPICFFQPWSELRQSVTDVLMQATRHRGGYIFNVGHGLTPETPLGALAHTVDFVHHWPQGSV